METLAVIQTGGKQYLVREGEVLRVEKLPVTEGEKVVFEEVLLRHKDGTTEVGTPTVSGAKVEAQVLEQGKAKKIRVVRFRAKSRYHRTYGHRQPYTQVKIEKIS